MYVYSYVYVGVWVYLLDFSKFSLNNTCNLQTESMRSPSMAVPTEDDFDGDVAELTERKAKVEDPMNLLGDPVLKREYELLRSVGEEYVTDRELVALLKRKPDSFGASNRVAENENASLPENANEDTIGMSEPISVFACKTPEPMCEPIHGVGSPRLLTVFDTSNRRSSGSIIKASFATL